MFLYGNRKRSEVNLDMNVDWVFEAKFNLRDIASSHWQNVGHFGTAINPN